MTVLNVNEGEGMWSGGFAAGAPSLSLPNPLSSRRLRRLPLLLASQKMKIFLSFFSPLYISRGICTARGPVRQVFSQRILLSRILCKIRPHRYNNLACWIINLLLVVLLCSIAEYFNELCRILTSP